MPTQESFDTTARAFLRRTKGDDGAELIRVKNVSYLYRGGAWSAVGPDEQDQLDAMLWEVARSTQFPISTAERTLKRTIEVMALPEKPVTFDAVPRLACRNGVLDLDTSQLLEAHPTLYTTRAVDVDFDPEARCPEWLAMLNRVFADYKSKDKKEAIACIQEYFGLGIVANAQHTSNRGLRKMMILVGPGRTGKSTIASVLRRFFAADRVCSATLDTLGQQFGAANLLGKLAVIADDAISKRTRADTNLLKKLVTGEEVTADRKFEKAAAFRFCGPIVFTANTMPDMRDDDTNAVFMRTLVVECTKQFTDDDAAQLVGGNAVQHLEHHNEFPGILNWALQGYLRAVERGHIIEPRKAANAAEHVRMQQNPTFDFLKRFGTLDPNVYNSVQMVAAAVSVFAADEHQAKVSRNGAASWIGRMVQEAVPGVKRGKVTDDGVQSRVLIGLRINKEGQAYAKLAKDRGLLMPGQPIIMNEAVL